MSVASPIVSTRTGQTHDARTHDDSTRHAHAHKHTARVSGRGSVQRDAAMLLMYSSQATAITSTQLERLDDRATDGERELASHRGLVCTHRDGDVCPPYLSICGMNASR